MSRYKLFSLPAIEITQPLGKFYVTAMDSARLSEIAYADVRRYEKNSTAVEEFVGIQRTRDPKRIKDIAQYVHSVDATFPTSVVISIEDERCISFDEHSRELTIYEVGADSDGPVVDKKEIARILDGQHRLAGLEEGQFHFELPVTIFAGIEIPDEAYIFATVNLAQTKVNSSLAYDLLAYAKSRSPERTCHDVTVALNRAEGSPFRKKIKRLGSATEGVAGETLTQATFVKALLPYISRDPLGDREQLRRGGMLPLQKDAKEIRLMPFRNLFIQERDTQIGEIIWEYFDSVSKRWPSAWASEDKGQIIRRTNGFKAFMRVLGDAYFLLNGSDQKYPKADDYLRIWEHSKIADDQFTSDVYKPGSSGEKQLAESLTTALNQFRTYGAKTSA